MFKNLHELITQMPDDATCRKYLADVRWNGNPICPYCQHTKCYIIEGGKRYKCASKDCYRKFSVTVGTIFEASNIRLHKWFMAIYLCTAHKKGISSYQLGKDIGVSQKTAWFMLHRIREMMKEKVTPVLRHTVEADETFVGGSFENMSNQKRKQFAAGNVDWRKNKTTVLGMHQRARVSFVERPHKVIKGKTVKEKRIEQDSITVLKVMPENKDVTIAATVRQHVEYATKLITDTGSPYNPLSDDYYHYTVNHAMNEFARWIYTTNSMEGTFSHFKRMIIGIYHQVTPKHLQRYCDEFTYRYNSRRIKDADRFNASLHRVAGRLKYKTLIAKIQ